MQEGTGKIRSTYLICTQEGQRYTGDGFRSTWQRLMSKALADRVIEERFTFNDIRAKHASDSQPDEATERLGHDDPRTTRRIYRRGPRQVHPLRPKIFGNR
jgi:integrase